MRTARATRVSVDIAQSRDRCNFRGYSGAFHSFALYALPIVGTDLPVSRWIANRAVDLPGWTDACGFSGDFLLVLHHAISELASLASASRGAHIYHTTDKRRNEKELLGFGGIVSYTCNVI